MALKSKQDNLPEEFETNEPEQISFEDIDFEAEYVDEDEQQESKKFYTISGKESWYEPQWERYGIADLNIGDEFESASSKTKTKPMMQ